MTHLGKIFISILFLTSALQLTAQNSVGIGTALPNTNAVLELVSPNSNQGLLIPRMTSTQRNDPSFISNLDGEDQALLVFDSDENSFYFWSGTAWVRVGNSLIAGTGISLAADGTITNTGDVDETNELQDLSFADGQISLSADPDGTVIDLRGYDSDASDDFDGSFTNLTDIPAELLDGDDDSQLTDAEIAAFGYIKTDNVNDADADPENEIQDLQLISNVLTITGNNSPTQIDLTPFFSQNTDEQTLSLSGSTLEITGGNSIDIASVDTDNQVLSLLGSELSISGGNSLDVSSIDTDNQTISLSGTDLSIVDGNTVSLASIQDGIGTDDQQLTFDGSFYTLAIEGGNTVDLSSLATDNVVDADADPANEIQDLLLSGNILTITNNGSATPIDLSPFSGTNTDNQTLALSGTDLTITGGNSIDLSSVNTDNQTLTFTGANLSIANGNTIDLSGLQDGFEANTDSQSLSLSGNSLSISGGNTIDIGGVDTDDQQLNFDGSFNTLSIDGGNSVDLSPLAIDNVNDADADPGNEYNTAFEVNGGNLELTDGGATLLVPLISLQDGTGTDDQQLNFDGSFYTLAIEGGNTVDLSSLATDNVVDADADPSNEYNSSFGINASNLELTDGGGTLTVALSAIQDGFEANTDNQTLSLSGNDLSIVGGNTIDLSPINTDNQTLTLSGALLEISSGNSVDLALLQDGIGTDDQQLSFDTDNNFLTIEAGNTVDLSSLAGDSTDELLSSGAMSGNTLRLFEGSNNINIDLSQFAELPVQSGNSGRYLTTNGTNPSWATVPSSPWVDGGGSISYTSGNVGIGVAIPLASAQLEVETTTYSRGIYVDNNLPTGSSYGVQIAMNTGNLSTKYGMYISGEDRNYLSGNLGVGVVSPSARLDVLGDSELNGDIRLNGRVSGNSTVYSVNSSNYTLSAPNTRIVRVSNAINDGVTTLARITGIDPGIDGQEFFLVISDPDPFSSANSVVYLDRTFANDPTPVFTDSNSQSLTKGSVAHFLYDGAVGGWVLISVSRNSETVFN